MEDSATYTLYFMKESGNRKQAVIEISSLKGRNLINSKNNDNDLESLAQTFVKLGLRISKRDKVQTISPVIINEWAPKPWNRDSGVEAAINDGEMVLYSSLTSEQLHTFYGHYLSAVELERIKIKRELKPSQD